MRSIKTIVRNSVLLFKLTGSFQLKKETMRKGRIYLPPFKVKVSNNFIAIVLSYIDMSEPHLLVFKKIWLSPDIFSSKELIGINKRNPYFETIIEILNVYLRAFKLTFGHYQVREIGYMFSIKNQNDEALAEVLKWYGFRVDMKRTLRKFRPTTTWRDKEILTFFMYVKKLV